MNSLWERLIISFCYNSEFIILVSFSSSRRNCAISYNSADEKYRLRKLSFNRRQVIIGKLISSQSSRTYRPTSPSHYLPLSFSLAQELRIDTKLEEFLQLYSTKVQEGGGKKGMEQRVLSMQGFRDIYVTGAETFQPLAQALGSVSTGHLKL